MTYTTASIFHQDKMIEIQRGVRGQYIHTNPLHPSLRADVVVSRDVLYTVWIYARARVRVRARKTPQFPLNHAGACALHDPPHHHSVREQ